MIKPVMRLVPKPIYKIFFNRPNEFNLNINQRSKIIEADEIIKFDINSNLILYYINIFISL